MESGRAGGILGRFTCLVPLVQFKTHRQETRAPNPFPQLDAFFNAVFPKEGWFCALLASTETEMWDP